MAWQPNDKTIWQAAQAAKLYVKKNHRQGRRLGEEDYEDLAQATAVDLAKQHPGSIKAMTGLAIEIFKKKISRHFKRKYRDEGIEHYARTESASSAELDTDHIDAKQYRHGFRTLDEQKAAVVDRCRTEFRQSIGREWGGEGEAAYFRGDRSAAERGEDREAQKLIEQLRSAVCEVMACKKVRSYQARQLQHFATLLQPLVNDVQWKIWQPRVDLSFIDTFRSLLVAEHDNDNFFGLKRRPTVRELAIISLLCGKYPSGVTKSHGVEKVIAAEMRALSKPQALYGGMRDLKPRERRKVRGRKPKR